MVVVALDYLAGPLHRTGKKERNSHSLPELEDLLKETGANFLLVLEVQNKIAELMGHEPVVQTYRKILAGTAIGRIVRTRFAEIEDHRFVNFLRYQFEHGGKITPLP